MTWRYVPYSTVVIYRLRIADITNVMHNDEILANTSHNACTVLLLSATKLPHIMVQFTSMYTVINYSV